MVSPRTFPRLRPSAYSADCFTELSLHEWSSSHKLPTVTFTGFIAPPSIPIETTRGPYVWRDQTLGTVSMTFSIKGTAIRADCEIDSIDDANIIILQWWVLSFVDAVVDAIAFSVGQGIAAFISHYELPGFPEKPFSVRDEELKAVCLLPTSEILSLAEKERGIIKHLHDLVHTLLRPLDSAVNCFRAIEGFRKLMSPDAEKNQQWKTLRDNLNLTEGYLMFVTKLSEGFRHGDVGPQNTKDILETRKRAWTVAYRFLEYRRRGNTPLPISEFPPL